MKEKPDRAERRRRFREQVRENPRLAAVYFILRLLVLADFGIRKLCSYITSGRRVSASG